MMKVMIFNKTGDDDYFIRLLSYFQSQFQENIIELVPFRQNVILLKTDKNTYMIKGYPTNNRLKLQESFTTTLRKEGFLKTYLFVQPKVKEPLCFEGSYFGCMEYIEPDKTPFTFHTQKNRQAGVELLEQFHQVTAAFEARYRTLIPTSLIIEKWNYRATLFSNNLSFMKNFIKEPFISEILEWANWSLQGMEEHRPFFIDKPLVILHGDVAHHNFLLDIAGRLHLIDFDLISIGPECLDYLQYANRILPYIDWSFERLCHFSKFHQLLKDKAFLYALAFPADIFREWNRLIREKTYTDHLKYKKVMDLTIGQFNSRKKFFNHLMKLTS